MTISKKDMTEYEFTTEMRDHLIRAKDEIDEIIEHNKGYFEEDEQFQVRLHALSHGLDSLVSEANKIIGIHYRRLTE